MFQLLFSTWFIEVLLFEGLREDRETLRNEYCAKNMLLFHQDFSYFVVSMITSVVLSEILISAAGCDSVLVVSFKRQPILYY